MNRCSNILAFFALLRSGLWEEEVQLLPFDKVDYEEVMRIAEEQSVVGLVTAGLESVRDEKVPQEILLQFIGSTLQIEQRNKDMNRFISQLIEILRKEDVYSVLVKGQGIAQCYERPLWRSCGDVDLLLNRDNYLKAKNVLLPLTTSVEEESIELMHLGMQIDSWVVELHGTLRSCIMKRMDRVIDEVQDDVFYGGNVRSWDNSCVQVFLPSHNNDVFLVFTHILKHFFRGGIGLRQICDWCRLLKAAKGRLDIKLLECRLKSAGIMTEWKVFGAIAVDYLGMPIDAMPLYSSKNIWKMKAERVLKHILAVGNFGHNRDLSYYINRPYIVHKAISFGRRTSDSFRHLFIFPMDSLRVWMRTLSSGLLAVVEKRW